jgi:hypothetical protein
VAHKEKAYLFGRFFSFAGWGNLIMKAHFKNGMIGLVPEKECDRNE